MYLYNDFFYLNFVGHRIFKQLSCLIKMNKITTDVIITFDIFHLFLTVG